MDRRTFLAAGGALALGACATPPRGVFESTAVPAPQWRAGDSWTFRRTDGYNGLERGVLTRTVEAADPTRIRFVTRDEHGRVLDDALFEAPGVEVSGTLSENGPVAGTFTPRLIQYDFPLASGKQWRQDFTRTDANGYRIGATASTHVEGWEDVGARDKTRRALVIHRSFMLGPKNPFTRPLNREEVEWYAPDLRGPARLRVYEWYTPPPGGFTYRGDYFLYALESFRLA